MKTSSDSRDDATRQDELYALLAHAPHYTPSAGLADRVITALHEEEAYAAAPLPLRRPWYLRPSSWGSAAAAACLVATLCLLPMQETSTSSAALAVDDALLVEEVLDTIDDPDLVSAICSVSIAF